MNRHALGLVGAGIMGRRLAAVAQAHPRFRVAAVFDPDPAAAQAAAHALGRVRIAPDLPSLVGGGDVDAVYVASPPAFHRAAVEAAVAARKPVLCEKPLAHTTADAQALRDAVVASGLPFAVNFPFARAAASRRLQALVQGGELGAIRQASVRLRFAQWPRAWQAGAASWLSGPAQGGFTREVLSHFVFLALRLFGPASVERLAIERVPGQAETRLLARLRHAAMTVDIDAAVEGEVADDNRFELVGERGSASLSQWFRLEHGDECIERSDPTPGTLDGFAALLDGAADHGLATVDEGLAVARLIEALLAD